MDKRSHKWWFELEGRGGALSREVFEAGTIAAKRIKLERDRAIVD